jgi:hypothetical protein
MIKENIETKQVKKHDNKKKPKIRNFKNKNKTTRSITSTSRQTYLN